MGSPIDEDLAFAQAEVSSRPDDMMRRSCTNFKCEVADVNNGIPINFKAVKCVSVGSDQPCCDIISRYIQFD